MLLSLFQISDLVINKQEDIPVHSLIRLKYLILAYALLLIMMAAFFFFEDFQTNVIVVFLFCLNVSIAFTLCQQVVGHIPPPPKSNNLLIPQHKLSGYEKSVMKSYLSLFYLTYMYAVIGAIMLGIFLLIRFILIKYYERRLRR